MFRARGGSFRDSCIEQSMRSLEDKKFIKKN